MLEKGDAVQASEKYYKAAEEAVKLLAVSRGLEDEVMRNSRSIHEIAEILG
ncbi:hypothetical protein L3N51_01069 [Metallosphaera sp. J1]|nr:PaREP1 family protein [Metallosphaera javensis (ex Hofmann et al. 2022)]MCG3108781.1 hypothetical protein [Metallosphaera javensis (ex Hofmann et al. 2022)]BCS94288.1 MAG: hypothetical protein MjAS7_2896 [Metallosphaera javensis (ex Sakai et al. 2022)]